MNLKIFTGLLSVGMFIASCATTNSVQPNKTNNTVESSSVIDLSPVTGIKGGVSINFKISFPGFKTKASGNGITSQDIDILKVNVGQNKLDPLGTLPDRSWISFKWEDSDNITMRNVNAGIWYGFLRAFDADGNEITAENEELTGNQKVAVSTNVLYVRHDKFYTDNTFTTVDPNLNVLNLTLPVQNEGASVSAELNVNEDLEIPPIQAE